MMVHSTYNTVCLHVYCLVYCMRLSLFTVLLLLSVCIVAAVAAVVVVVVVIAVVVVTVVAAADLINVDVGDVVLLLLRLM